MPALDQQQIDHLSRLMDERWSREFSEIRALTAGMDEERQRVALGERAADTADNGRRTQRMKPCSIPCLRLMKPLFDRICRTCVMSLRLVSESRPESMASASTATAISGMNASSPTRQPSAVLIASANMNTGRPPAKGAPSSCSSLRGMS